LSATDRILAIGVPFESAAGSGRDDAGAVSVLYGNGAPRACHTDDLWRRDTRCRRASPAHTVAEAGEPFGAPVAVAPVAPPLMLQDVLLAITALFVDIGRRRRPTPGP
jgi:hypothetical protein